MQSNAAWAKKLYLAPELREPKREQAVLFLLGHDWDGDPNAKDLLKMLFPDPSEKKPK